MPFSFGGGIINTPGKVEWTASSKLVSSTGSLSRSWPSLNDTGLWVYMETCRSIIWITQNIRRTDSRSIEACIKSAVGTGVMTGCSESCKPNACTICSAKSGVNRVQQGGHPRFRGRTSVSQVGWCGRVLYNKLVDH